MKKVISCFFMLMCICITTQKISAQGLQPDSIKAQFVKDWERAKAYTDEYLAAMPADKYTARPLPDVRSFSEQMLHLSTMIIGLVSVSTNKARIYEFYNMEKSPTAQNKDSVVFYVNTCYDYAINAIKNMDASKLGEHVKRAFYDETKFALLMKAFEHQTHHRGQCAIYLRMQGVRPPEEKLF